MNAATIRVRRPSGTLATFDADRLRIADGLVTATGRWRDDRRRKRRAYTWPRGRVVEIAYADSEAVA